MKKINQKGSVTVFVLLSCLFFIMFLTSMFMLASIKRQSQIEATKQTQNIYSQGNANEIYNNYFEEGSIVPIYTKAQLEKICSGEQIAISEEGGKIYTFSENAVYLLKDDISFEYNGIWEMPSFGETGRIEGDGKTITIKDTTKEEFYYYYTDINKYKEPLTEEGYLLTWDKNKVSTTKVEESTIAGVKDVRIVPIPEGFVMSSLPGENTVAGGLVIYEGEDKVIDEDDDGNKIIDAQEERNQYVWIPVDDINQMVMCKNNSSNSVCSLVLQEDSTLKCETHDSTDLCGRLYGTSSKGSTVDGNEIYTTSMNFADRTQIWDEDRYHEPVILDSSYDNEDNTGGLTLFTEKMINGFTQMAISVTKYGGFYTSRYEAGYEKVNEEDKIGISKKNKIVITANIISQQSNVAKGVGKWYGLFDAVYKEIKVSNTKIMQSHMIYGCQYDQIINFLETNSSNVPQIGHTERQLKERVLTGANIADVMSNIYDLEGNNIEWTAQGYSSSSRVYRGGFYDNANGNKYDPASRIELFQPHYTSDPYTTRFSLYF